MVILYNLYLHHVHKLNIVNNDHVVQPNVEEPELNLDVVSQAKRLDLPSNFLDILLDELGVDNVTEVYLNNSLFPNN